MHYYYSYNFLSLLFCFSSTKEKKTCICVSSFSLSTTQQEHESYPRSSLSTYRTPAMQICAYAIPSPTIKTNQSTKPPPIDFPYPPSQTNKELLPRIHYYSYTLLISYTPSILRGPSNLPHLRQKSSSTDS